MKIKSGYILKEVAGENIVVAVGEESAKFGGMLNLNDAGSLLWEMLSQKEGATSAQLAQRLQDEFGIDTETAANDTEDFLKKLNIAGFLE